MAELDRAVLKVAGATVTLVGGGLAVVAPQVAQASTFPVTDETSLRQAIYSANSASGADTITIAAGTIALSADLPNITEELVIIGAGQGVTIIDGADAYKVFYAESSTSLLTVSSMTIQYAFDESGGAAIHAHGSLTVSSVSFLYNTVTNSSYSAGRMNYGGGAVFVHDAAPNTDVTITDSVFKGNVANGAYLGYPQFTYADGAGGAININLRAPQIYASSTVENDVTITNTTFYGNYSNDDGGAVFIRAHEGVVDISGSTFVYNSVYADGGAVAINDAATVTISTSTFSGNTAVKSQGGAVYLAGSETTNTISSSTFTGNSADEGGAVALDASSLVVDSVTFDDNTSADEGGAIYAGSQDLTSVITVTDSVFTDNQALGEFSGKGGAIKSSDFLSVADSTFSGNSAGNDGGAIFAYLDSRRGSADEAIRLMVQNSTLSANYAAGDGGAIFAEYITVHVEQSTIYGNTSAHYGGAMASDDSIVMVSNSTIVGNSALLAGAFYSDGSVMQIDDTILWDNTDNYDDDQVIGEASLSGANNLEGVDPMLNPLADNGGTTLTMLPKIGSPALDAGNNAIQPFAEDQRGSARVYKDVIDIGAVEATAEERGESLPPTGAGSERAAWLAALLAGVGAVFTFGARRPSRRS